jgi:hypothetical protein
MPKFAAVPQAGILQAGQRLPSQPPWNLDELSGTQRFFATQ